MFDYLIDYCQPWDRPVLTYESKLVIQLVTWSLVRITHHNDNWLSIAY
jgi:hypothetical protein